MIERIPRIRFCSWLVVMLVASGPPLLKGQITNQSIQGLVTDESGAVIVGARITIANLATGIQRTTATNATGNYTLTPVDVGNYDITCELDGFKTDHVRAQRVETAATVRVNFVLQVGDLTETVEVSAAAVTLNTENAVVGTVVENKRVTELPLNGRNMVQLAVLVPGVQFGQRTGMADGAGGFPMPGQNYSVTANGVREMHQVVSLDGVDAQEPLRGTANFVPSIEAIEEFKVQTNAYSAEFGFGGGAVTSVTMKSGTNDFHGTIFEFLRNDKIDAENYFLNFERPGEREPKDKLRRNQFGAVASGPIIKNRTFWAFNWEARREVVGDLQETWFPIDSFRNGDFSELVSDSFLEAGNQSPILLFDAFTGDPFPNNILPTARIHHGAKNLLDQFVPRAHFREADPLRETARSAIDQPIASNLLFGRLDHHFTDADRFLARLAWNEAGREHAPINPNFPGFHDARFVNLATSWVHTLSQNAINDLRFGLNVAIDEITDPRLHDENFDVESLGIGKFRIVSDGNRPLGSLEQGLPFLRGLPFEFGDLGYRHNPSYTTQISNQLSVITGAHNLKFGGEYRRIALERDAGSPGRLDFGSNESGLPFASYLLGLPVQTFTPLGLSESNSRTNRVGFFAQDDWKLHPKLTLNLGLRFDYNGNPVDQDGFWRSVNFCGEALPSGRGPRLLCGSRYGNRISNDGTGVDRTRR